MSWHDIELASGLGKKDASKFAVLARCNAAGTKRSQALRIVVRPGLVEGGIDWWKVGVFVQVRVGRGEHAGMLRITPAATPGSLRLVRSAGNTVVALSLPGFRPLPKDEKQPEPIEFDHNDTFLEVTLPAWARAAPVPAATGKQGPTAASSPFIGIASGARADAFAGPKGGGPVKEIGR